MHRMGQDVSVTPAFGMLRRKVTEHPLSSVSILGRQGTSCFPCALHSRNEEAAGKVLLTVGEGVFASVEVLMCVRVRSEFTPVWLRSPAACFRQMLVPLWRFSLPHLCALGDCRWWWRGGEGIRLCRTQCWALLLPVALGSTQLSLHSFPPSGRDSKASADCSFPVVKLASLFWQLLSEVLTNFRSIRAKHRYGPSLGSVALVFPSPCRMVSPRISASFVSLIAQCMGLPHICYDLEVQRPKPTPATGSSTYCLWIPG
jgi:hypothetical protein